MDLEMLCISMDEVKEMLDVIVPENLSDLTEKEIYRYWVDRFISELRKTIHKKECQYRKDRVKGKEEKVLSFLKERT